MPLSPLLLHHAEGDPPCGRALLGGFLPESVIERQANLGDKYLDDYLQLVNDVVDGKVKESHADRVAKVLDNAKKTVDDLSSDVMLCRQRRQWKSQLDEVPNIEEDIATVEGQLDSLSKEFEKFEEEVDKRAKPLEDRMYFLKRSLNQGREAKQHLHQRILDPRLKARMNELNEELRKQTLVTKELRDRRSDVNASHGTRVNNAKHRATGDNSYQPSIHPHHQEEIDRLASHLEETKKRIDEAMKQEEEINERIDEVGRQILEA